jgi:hypothetical protein
VYTRCPSCHAPLGSNEVVEDFPVGRGLAFDPERGRLWAICRGCRSWHLAPILERWEAIETLERAFEGVRVEGSTGRVALGRTADGTRLIRVGTSERREFAFWRYTHRLRRRLRTVEGAGFVLTTPLLLGAIGVGPSLVLSMPAVLGLGSAALYWWDHRPLLRTADGEVIRKGDGRKIRLIPESEAAGWSLEIPRRRGPLSLTGPEALRTLRATLPRANLDVRHRKGLVDEAVARVGEIRSRDRRLSVFARQLGHAYNTDPEHNALVVTRPGRARPHRVATALPALRLAVEIAANEEVERRALEGEMALIEREWQEAEELAGISDNLLIPEWIEEWVRSRG